MYQSILVPVDGSEYARKALEVAGRLIAPSGVIYLLNVAEPLPAEDLLGRAVGAPAPEASEDEAEAAGYNLIEHLRQAEQSGHDLIERFKTAVGLSGVAMKPVVRTGKPAEVIVEEAGKRAVDAIVMGSRGMSDLKGLVVGSVSHKVMHTAGCTAIIVH